MSAQRTTTQPGVSFAAVMVALLAIGFPQEALWIVSLLWTGLVLTAEFVQSVSSPVFSLLSDIARRFF